ncbi:MAG: ketopantoate reductase family protein [Promethearchaeota archaeon]
MSQREIYIGIIGAGSIGSLIGACLASLKSKKYSPNVVFFVKESQFNVFKNDGLHLLKADSEILLKNLDVFMSIEGFKEKKTWSFDFLFLTTKAYDIEVTMIQYKELIDDCKYLVILQNGIGNEEVAIKYCKKDKIIRGVTTNGALVEKPGRVKHTGIGITKIGFPFYDENLSNNARIFLELLKDLLNDAGLETIIVDDIIRECWEKIFVNIGINAIGALTRLKNGELLEFKGIKSLMAGAIKEALIVADKKNIILTKKDYVALTFNVAEKTYQNKNSMLQDILKGKKTEIEFINAKIVEYSKELNIEVPINKILTTLIKGLEQGKN